MRLILKTPAQSINKIYQKDKIHRNNFDKFKSELDTIISKIDGKESEEHLKIFLIQFLKNTFYKENEVNTKGRTDLAIYNGNDNKSTVGIIFETKKPANKSDMITKTDINKKALHEIILYYLTERIENKNNEIKNIIITNLYEWFIFDAVDFERVFYTQFLIKEYNKWKSGQKTSKNTDLFYNEIAKRYIAQNDTTINCTFVNLRDFKNLSNIPDSKITNLYKLFSPEHLLKKARANDSNSLDTTFYNELLHIIGLREIKEDKKQIITRLKPKDRNPASLLENAINILDTEDRLKHIKDLEERYGEKKDEQLFNVALELSIMWINRIIFLKLLEAQLFQYNRDNAEYLFLNIKTVSNFNELNELFFEVLAKKPDDRNEHIKEKYAKIPYLNSSLFEISKLEDETIRINSLKEHFKLPVNNKNIIKDENELPILEYIFKFLNAYDFTNEGHGKIQEENKNLINASVLGLIFEKINGYKEGSYFTPGYITMYMTRENIRRAVIRKFKDAGFELTNTSNLSEGFNQLKDKITNRKEANEIINSLKICDPSVGSGHFLVSALNEIIAIKSELDVLQYHNGNRVKNHKIEVQNDELIITDKETDELFEYNLSAKGNAVDYKQELQKTLFHEKQIIIENCLFGVDINPNSVNITRLRLWIELLKNSYYTEKSNFTELETLPNIDINIKQGNSLVGRFALNGNGISNGQAQKMRLATEKYKTQVILYKSTNDKTVKQNAEKEILKIKEQFAQSVNPTDKDYILLKQKKAKLGEMPIFFTREDKENWKKKTEKLATEIAELEKAYNEKLHTLYGKAFEWRFEFPEVLDENGNFVGFDIVIGNPPYISAVDMARNKQIKEYNKNNYPIAKGAYDIYILFLKKGLDLLKENGVYSWIIPNKFLSAQYSQKIKKELIEKGLIKSIDISHIKVFKKASVYPIIIIGEKKTAKQNFTEYYVKDENNLLKEIFTEYKKLKEYKTFKDFGIKLMSGTTGFEAQKIKKLISETKTKNSLPFIVSGCIDKYAADFRNVKFMRKKFKKAYISNKNNSIAKSKWTFWQNNKIVIAGMTKQIEAIYAEKPLAIGVGTYGIYDFGGFEPKFILAILNSKFLTSYVFKKFKDKHLAGGYLAVNKNNIEQFPLMNASEKTQKEIVKLVDKILKLKQKDINADTRKIEAEIDKMVYKIYDLTDEEIQIIENETA